MPDPLDFSRRKPLFADGPGCFLIRWLRVHCVAQLTNKAVQRKGNPMSRITAYVPALSLLLAPVLCCAAEPNVDQATAIAEIEKLGGTVTLHEKSPGEPALEVNLTGTTVTDAGLANLEGLNNLKSLQLHRTEVTDAGLAHLKGSGNSNSYASQLMRGGRGPRSPTPGWSTSKG